MAGWMNSDGLYVKFGGDEADLIKGGHMIDGANKHQLEVIVDYTDLLSATAAVLGSASVTTDGTFGITMPKGARIEAVETVVQAAFTSSGTIGSATFVLGLKKASDRSTELDHDGFLTASATGTALGLATVGSRVYTGNASPGGALIGTTLAENGVISVSNSAHATHPYTAGKLRVRLYYFFV
jgi:hypothetical protein